MDIIITASLCHRQVGLTSIHSTGNALDLTFTCFVWQCILIVILFL